MSTLWNKYIDKACSDVRSKLDQPYSELLSEQRSMFASKLAYFDALSGGESYTRSFERVANETRLSSLDFKRQILIQDSLVLPFSCNDAQLLENQGVPFHEVCKEGRIMPDLSDERKKVFFEFIRIEKDDEHFVSKDEDPKVLDTNEHKSLVNVPFIFIRDDLLELVGDDPEHGIVKSYKELFEYFNHDYLHFCTSHYFVGRSRSIEESGIEFDVKYGEFSDPLSRESFFLKAHAQYLSGQQEELDVHAEQFLGALKQTIEEKRSAGGSARECHKVVQEWGGLIGSLYMSAMPVDDPRMNKLLEGLIEIDPMPHFIWDDVRDKLELNDSVSVADPYEMLGQVVQEVHNRSRGASVPSQMALRNYFQKGSSILQDNPAGFDHMEAMRYLLVRDNPGYAYIFSPEDHDGRVARGNDRVESIVKRMSLVIDS